MARPSRWTAARRWQRAEIFISCASGPMPTGRRRARRSRHRTKRTARQEGDAGTDQPRALGVAEGNCHSAKLKTSWRMGPGVRRDDAAKKKMRVTGGNMSVSGEPANLV